MKERESRTAMSTLHNPPELCYTTTTETTSALEAPSAPTNEALENAIRGELFSYWTSREEMFKHRMQAGRLLNVLRKSTPYGQWLPALKRIGVPERRALVLHAVGEVQIRKHCGLRRVQDHPPDRRRDQRSEPSARRAARRPRAGRADRGRI